MRLEVEVDGGRIGPADDHGRVGAGQILAQPEPGKGGRTARLGYDAQPLPQQTLGGPDLVVGHEDHLVDEPLDDGEGQHADALRRQRVGGDAFRRCIDGLASGVGPGQGWSALGFYPDNASGAGEPGCRPADQSAAADRSKDRGGVGGLLLEFQPERPRTQEGLPGVEGMDRQCARIGFPLPAGLKGVVVTGPGDHELGPAIADANHLGRRRDLGHEDGCGHIDPHGGIGDGDAVVAARRGDDAGIGNLACQEVGESSSRLEGSGVLKEFQLERDGAVEVEIATLGRHRRCTPDVGTDVRLDGRDGCSGDVVGHVRHRTGRPGERNVVTVPAVDIEAPTWGQVSPAELRVIVAVSPHFDDAAMGAGQMLLRHAGVARTAVVTVFGGPPSGYPDPPTEWDALGGFQGGDDVVAVRRNEDRAAMAVLGAEPVWLDFVDHQYLEPGNRLAAADVAPALAGAIGGLEPTAVFLPMGLANPDHVVTHEAGLLVRERLPGVAWFAYEDQGYKHLPGLLAWRVSRLFRSGLWPTPAVVPVDPDPTGKWEAVRCYQSQLPPLERDHELAERLDANVPEQFWRLAPPPRGWELLTEV